MQGGNDIRDRLRELAAKAQLSKTTRKFTALVKEFNQPLNAVGLIEPLLRPKRRTDGRGRSVAGHASSAQRNLVG